MPGGGMMLQQVKKWMAAAPRLNLKSLEGLVTHPAFERFVIGVIVVNAIALGLETSQTVMGSIGTYFESSFSARASEASTGVRKLCPMLSSFSRTKPVRLPLTQALEKTRADSSRRACLANSTVSRAPPRFTCSAISRSAAG